MAPGECFFSKDDADLLRLTARNSVYVLYFNANWAEPCLALTPLVRELALQFLNITFVEINADTHSKACASYQVSSVPTFLILSDSKELKRIVGAKGFELAEAIEQYATIPANKLRQLIADNQVMLFVNDAQSTSTRELIDLLTCYCKFAAYNVANDANIREELATLSTCRTFPQIFVNGSFLGDLAAILQLHKTNELRVLLCQSLNHKLTALISKHQLMVFMKGTPSSPRCGFSSQLIALLCSINARFGYFDILSDDDVRQGLKKLSDWPTYPQVYHQGKLLGGLDIVREMIDAGEFPTNTEGPFPAQ